MCSPACAADRGHRNVVHQCTGRIPISKPSTRRFAADASAFHPLRNTRTPGLAATSPRRIPPPVVRTCCAYRRKPTSTPPPIPAPTTLPAHPRIPSLAEAPETPAAHQPTTFAERPPPLARTTTPSAALSRADPWKNCPNSHAPPQSSAHPTPSACRSAPARPPPNPRTNQAISQ